MSTISSTHAVARGMSVGRSKPMASIAVHQTASQRSAISPASRPSRSARSMILSSMSVMFDTSRTSIPDHVR